MPSSSTTNIKTGLMVLFFALAFFYIVFIIKIPVICNGCDPLEGVWYRCIRGTGIGTTTCDIANGTALSFNVDLTELTNIIQSSGLISLPKQWIQTLTNVWLSIKSFGQSLINQTISLYGYIQTQFSVIIKDYIVGYPKSGYDAFRDNVIVPMISGITNYIVNPVKSLITNIVDFKNTALSVFNSIVSTIKGASETVYDYTYGFLVDGFDQVPYGLVLFIEGIQKVLNFLKSGIISGANTALGGVTYVLTQISNGIFDFGNLAIGGAQSAVDGVTSGLESFINLMIENVINKTVGGINSAFNYDLGTPVRTGINTLVGFINTGYGAIVGTVINPLVGVINTVGTAVTGAVGSISDFDITGWIPEIDLKITSFKIPSWRPFSFIGKPSAPNVQTLSGNLVDPLTNAQLPAGSFASALGIPTIPTVNQVNIEVPDFETEAVAKLTAIKSDAQSTLDGVRVPEPADLFWAGTRDAGGPSGDVCTNIANAYPLETDDDGLPTKTYANTPGAVIYDQYNTSTCLYSSSVTVNNRFIGTSSCSDICYNSGKSAYDTNDVSSPNCDKQFTIYGTPEQNSIPRLTTPNGLSYYLYRGQPTVYFAPCLYRVNITVNTQSYTTVNGQRNYSVDESGMVTIADANKSDYVKLPNRGYKNIRTGRFYVLEKDLSSPGSIRAWEYYTNRFTDDRTGCNLEYLLTDTPESIGLQSQVLENGLTVYYLDEKPYIYLNPKLYRLNSSNLTAVSTNELLGSQSAYAFAIPYSDEKSGQIAIRYNQTGYSIDPSDVVRLPTQFVNNVEVALTPEQSGYTSNTLGKLFYYVNSNQKPYAYDRSGGRLFALNLNNMDFIVGTPESNGYVKETFGYSKGGFRRVFAVTEQAQYYVVLRQRGYRIDPTQRVTLPYTFVDNVVTYKSPSEAGYVIQPTDGYGLIYYRKDNVNYVYDQKGSGMVPLSSMTPTETIYGQPQESDYQVRLFGYEKNSSTFYFIPEQRFLVEYFTKSLFSPTCGCTTAFIVTKTCKDYCGSKYDSSNSAYGCDDDKNKQKTGYSCSDSRVTDFSQCACTEQGPVNIIVKPMKKYNPFRLLQQGISAGVGELSNMIKYSVQSFLTPVWNAIKSIFQFLVSIIVTVIQFLYNFFFGGESSPIYIQIKNFVSSIGTGFQKYVIDDFVNGIIIDGVKSIIPTQQQIMTILQPVIDIFSVAFDAMVTAFRYTFEALKTAATFLVRTVVPMFFYYLLYLFSSIADTVLFFLPLSRTEKMMLLFLIILVLLWQGSSLVQLGVAIVGLFVNMIVSSVTRVLATGIDLVFNF